MTPSLFHRSLRIALGSFLLAAFFLSTVANAKQESDKSYMPSIAAPTYPKEKGPHIVIDQKHNNMHTQSGSFLGFTKLMKADGYQVKPGKKTFTKKFLEPIDVLVIANARPKSKKSLSAFSEAEIQAVKVWVSNGGALLLIADHSPFPAFAQELAQAFGFDLINGIAFGSKKTSPRHQFSSEKGTLITEPWITSTNPNLSFTTFTGSAMSIPKGAVNVLKFTQDSWISSVPDGNFSAIKTADKYSLDGLSQGGLLSYQKGKVAVFGEAAAFTAQKNGKRIAGLHAKGAEGNEAFVLALMRWLSQPK